MSLLQFQQLEKIWEKEIEAGNSLFQSSAFPEAYLHYMEAMIVSEVLMENCSEFWKHAIRVPGMYYTACIKIAQNYWSMHDIKNATDYFHYCAYKLKMFAGKAGVDALLKQSASVHWLKALQLYGEFAEKTGIPMPPHMDKDDTYVQVKKLKDLLTFYKTKMN